MPIEFSYFLLIRLMLYRDTCISLLFPFYELVLVYFFPSGRIDKNTFVIIQLQVVHEGFRKPEILILSV